jgi:predicted transcriptional regulator
MNPIERGVTLESPMYTTTVAKMSQATFEDILTEAIGYGTEDLVQEFKKLNSTLEKILRELQRLNEVVREKRDEEC